MKKDEIIIRGAREHNLKNVSLSIPRNKITVFTGLSGSGKSSLAFDTLYAEGQRRYVESLSSYARQFMGKLNKPKVDKIIGISPAGVQRNLIIGSSIIFLLCINFNSGGTSPFFGILSIVLNVVSITP